MNPGPNSHTYVGNCIVFPSTVSILRDGDLTKKREEVLKSEALHGKM